MNEEQAQPAQRKARSARPSGSASVLELGHAKSSDAHCLACGFEMVGGRYVGLCPKCGSDRWYRTRLNKQSPKIGLGAAGAQLQGRVRDMASQQSHAIEPQEPSEEEYYEEIQRQQAMDEQPDV